MVEANSQKRLSKRSKPYSSLFSRNTDYFFIIFRMAISTFGFWMNSLFHLLDELKFVKNTIQTFFWNICSVRDINQSLSR